jgi:hypothetical protein
MVFQLSPPKQNRPCLLLDVSYSMNTNDGRGRRIDLLRKAVDTVPNLGATSIYCFSEECVKVRGVRNILEPQSSTAMDHAFTMIRGAGFESAILITDGMPDSEEAALRASAGLTLRILYVGPKPIPDFLKRLAQMTAGTCESQDLANTKLLSQKISGYLPARK